MNEKKPIRREIGDIFGVVIVEDEWNETFDIFDKQNNLNTKTIKKILLVILKRLEELEDVT